LTPDPWQQIVLDEWLAVKNGKWASLTCGLSVSRQNGKNALIEVRELFGLVGRGEKILHTAHEIKTARKAFLRLQHFFGKSKNDPGAKFPELNALVESVRNVNGQEAIFLTNGGSVEVIARTASSGRGFTVDVLVMDEAQEMTDADIEALMPTTSAAPLGDPQWIFTGTPPGPSARGEVFSRVRADAMSSKSSRMSWLEWSADPDADLDDHAAWWQANPALLTGRLQMSVIEGERGTYSDDGFSRERLGRWSVEGHRGIIPSEAWQSAEDDKSVPVDRFALGLEVGPDLSWASVALAGQREDQAWHVALEADQHTHGRGVEWVIPYVSALVEANPQLRTVVVDVAGPVVSLLDKRGQVWFFKGTKVRAQPIKVAELGSTCSSLLASVVTGGLKHLGQPQLSAAALSAGKRNLGDTGMWVWSRRSATSDITPIQAVTLALHGAQTENVKRPATPKTSGRVVVM